MAKPDRKPDPDFEPEYDVADPDYDDTSQASYSEGADPDYDEASQDADYEVSDPDAPEASQEYYKRSQK
ncbi:hypothetical protein [Hymenobacter cheonanensis]|uniref:hypothetical protein n=1 Tax=Hymenobacter sp. CA2-7 TaxID=3063993 RepID=UPI0027139F70|nr:hypothetical protein [Hymenobacter sp. CA2-7]MDO7888253.1 hypothetical protein [Hymenobacter sp. CA2-7]